MSEYLIRRNSIFTEFKNIKRINSSKKGYSETVISKQNRYPKSVGLELGDTVYVSESGVGIFAVGEVIGGVINDLKTDIKTCYSISDIIENYNINGDSSYWTDKLSRFYDKCKSSQGYKFRYHKYLLNQKLLTTTIPFEGPLKRYVKQGYAWSFTELSEEEVNYIKNPIITSNTGLDLEIPSKLKFELHSLFNKKINVGHWVDIDHLIPKSVGGPGNIKENLVPISFSLNRYKNNSIHKDFFLVAEDFLNYNLKAETKKIVRGNDGLINIKKNSVVYDEAKQINSKVWNKGIKVAKQFYGTIMEKNYPEYHRIITSEQ